MPLHLERESHQNCKQDPVGLKFLKCAPFFVSWIEGTSCTLLSQPTRPVFSLHHSHHKFPTFTATLHSLTTPHTPPYSYFSPHNTLPTLSPHTLHSLTTHSLLSHHTILTLSPHQSLSTHSSLSLQTPTFSFLPHHTLSILSTHHTPPTFTSKHSLTTHSHYHFTPHTPHSLNTPHTPNSLTTPHITNSLTAYSPLSHFTLPTFSPHILHFLAAHSPLSYHSLIPLPTLSPYHTIPTVSPHTPISHLTSYFRTSLISHLPPHSLTTLPTILLHFILSYKSQISFPLSNLTLLPHIPTFITLSTLSPHSPISRYTPHSHLIPNFSLSTFLSHSLYSLTTTPVPREDIEMRDGGVVCEHCIQGKYSPTFYFPFRLRCQRANLGLGEFQCFNFFL